MLVFAKIYSNIRSLWIDDLFIIEFTSTVFIERFTQWLKKRAIQLLLKQIRMKSSSRLPMKNFLWKIHRRRGEKHWIHCDLRSENLSSSKVKFQWSISLALVCLTYWKENLKKYKVSIWYLIKGWLDLPESPFTILNVATLKLWGLSCTMVLIMSFK